MAHTDLKFDRKEKGNKDHVFEIVKPTSGCEDHGEDGDCGDHVEDGDNILKDDVQAKTDVQDGGEVDANFIDEENIVER